MTSYLTNLDTEHARQRIPNKIQNCQVGATQRELHCYTPQAFSVLVWLIGFQKVSDPQGAKKLQHCSSLL